MLNERSFIEFNRITKQVTKKKATFQIQPNHYYASHAMKSQQMKTQILNHNKSIHKNTYMFVVLSIRTPGQI
jgi:hypothetical protein